MGSIFHFCISNFVWQIPKRLCINWSDIRPKAIPAPTRTARNSNRLNSSLSRFCLIKITLWQLSVWWEIEQPYTSQMNENKTNLIFPFFFTEQRCKGNYSSSTLPVCILRKVISRDWLIEIKQIQLDRAISKFFSIAKLNWICWRETYSVLIALPISQMFSRVTIPDKGNPQNNCFYDCIVFPKLALWIIYGSQKPQIDLNCT